METQGAAPPSANQRPSNKDQLRGRLHKIHTQLKRALEENTEQNSSQKFLQAALSLTEVQLHRQKKRRPRSPSDEAAASTPAQSHQADPATAAQPASPRQPPTAPSPTDNSTRAKLSKRLLTQLRDLHRAQPAIRIYSETEPFSIRAVRAHASPANLARLEELANPRSGPTLTTDNSPHQLCAASWAHHNAQTELALRIATAPAAPTMQLPFRALPPDISSGSEQASASATETEATEEHADHWPPLDLLESDNRSPPSIPETEPTTPDSQRQLDEPNAEQHGSPELTTLQPQFGIYSA